jgi:hypothetical protein
LNTKDETGGGIWCTWKNEKCIESFGGETSKEKATWKTQGQREGNIESDPE